MDSQQYNSNINLILNDEHHTETLNVDKKILIEKCEYFSRMLTQFSEINADTITIKVVDSTIAKNVIISMFSDIDIYKNIGNYYDWKYLLLLYKCCDFFNISFDITKLNKLLVPNEGFELLLDIIDIIGYNYDMIELIINNLPKNYDLRKFPRELLETLYDHSTSYNIVSGSLDRTIKIWNVETQDFNSKIFTKLSKTLRYFPINKEQIFDNNIKCMDYSHKFNQIISGSNGGIKLWNIDNREVIKEFQCDSEINDICFSPDGKSCVCANKFLSIYDLDNGRRKVLNLTRIKSIGCIKTCVCWTSDNIIACGDSDGVIEFWNAETNLIIKWCQVSKSRISNISFSPDRSQIAVSNQTKIILYDSIFSEKILEIKNSYIINFAYSPTEDVLVLIDGHLIKLYNCRTGNLFRTFNLYDRSSQDIKYFSLQSKIYFSPTGNQIIFTCDTKNENLVGIWNWKLNDDIIYLKGHQKQITSLCIIPDNENSTNKRIMNILKNQ